MTKTKTVPAKPYEPTPSELALVKKQKAERKYEIKVTVKKTKAGTSITPDHPDLGIGTALFMDALGTTDGEFLEVLIFQVANLTRASDEISEAKLNHTLSLIHGIAPQDPVEAMLAVQMSAVHIATLNYARRTNVADTFMESEMAEKAFNRLSRTFIAQMDTLKKYRTGGEQKMTVEHVAQVAAIEPCGHSGVHT